MKKLSLNAYGMMLALLVTLLASAGWVFTKVALREIEPIAFIAWRFCLAAVLLLPFCYQSLLKFTRIQWLISVVLGLALGSAISIWVEGMYRIAYIGEAAFIVSLMVVIIPLIARLFGRPLKKSLVFCLVPAVLGLYLLTGANGFNFEPAQLILLASAAFFSLHVVLSTEYLGAVPALASTAVQLSIAALLASALSYFTGSLDDFLHHDYQMLTWSMLLCSAFIATSLRFAVQTRAMSLISSTESSMIFSLGPIWTALLGWLLLAEKMSLTQWSGCALIFSAQLMYRTDGFLAARRQRANAN